MHGELNVAGVWYQALSDKLLPEVRGKTAAALGRQSCAVVDRLTVLNCCQVAVLLPSCSASKSCPQCWQPFPAVTV
jgi:hypothetical protein